MLIRKICCRPASAAVVFFMACIPVGVCAQEVAPTAVETRVFDIRSLLLEVPNYRAIFSDLRSDDLYRPSSASPGGTGGAPPDPPTNSSPPPLQTGTPKNAQNMIDLIASIVQPDTWRQNGGESGSMEFYGGQLVVRQTKPVMTEVEQLIDLIRAARVRKVSVEAWFIVVPSKAGERAALSPALARTEVTLEEFQKAMENLPGSVSLTRVSLTGFDGQRVYTSSGKQLNVKVGTQPVVDSQVVGYQPLPRQLLSGVALEVQPVAEPDRGLVLIDIRASLGKVDPTAEQPPKAGTVPDWELHTPWYQVAHFATSVSLPVGKVSRVAMTRYDENQDVVLFVLPSVE